MEHLKMHSLNKIDENVSKIAALFPNCVTEAKADDGSITKKIDFDLLKQELSNTLVEGREERYQFTWPDKKQAILTANAPINKTLRPCREESVDFDTTENLYIEGDNLEALKLLQETYLGKIKMIYIDPPYNTGNDFVYEDDFAQDASDYIANSGQTDEDGNRLVANTESNGRFHTDWLNMIYPRLKIARDLLSDDGVIFISIGQDEIENMIKLCDEVFSHDNKCGIISRLMKSGGAKGTFFSPNIEYIVVYAKNISLAKSFREPISEEIIKKLYTSIETQGERKGQKYRPFGLYQSSLDARPNQRYFIQCPDGTLVIPPGKTLPKEKIDGAGVKPDDNDGCWRWSRERYIEERKKGNIEFKESKGVLIDSEGKPAKWNIYTKIWLDDRQEEGMTPVDLITKWENRQSKKELTELKIPFDFAKPTDLIKYLITISQENDSIILDFFSGSATTAHAVMQLNAEDDGNRKFIMVQLPEITDEKSEAFKAGYKNICEIGKERIRRAGKKIKEDSPLTTENLDTGFRVLKIDSSNMEDVYYTPDHIDTNDLFKNNIKSDRTGEDLLFQTMLDLGIMLSSKIETKKINDKEVFCVEGNYLMACFDDSVDEKTITEIAKEKPYYFVMRDPANSKDGDSLITNFEQIFTTYSPDTVRKVL